METVKVSPKFQVVIPRRLRERLDIRPGQRIQVLLYDDRLVFVPLKPVKKMRGFLSGIDTTVERERDRL
jgi:AbrB family looped-hinge helix DNA binding protein